MTENEPQVEKTTETVTEHVEASVADKREELRTPEPAVVKETVVEKTVSDDKGGNDT